MNNDHHNSNRPGRSGRRGSNQDPNGSERRTGGRGEYEPDRRAYAFEHEVAEELVALLRDDEGDADEDLLDDAREALERPLQPRDAERHQLLLWLADNERDAVIAILDETTVDTNLARHVAHHLDRRLRRRLEEDRG